MENLDLAYSMFNQHLYQDAKNNIEFIEYYFQTNPNTMSNPMIADFVYAIKTYSFDSIGAPLFQSIMMKNGKSQAETDRVMGEIVRWKKYNRDQIAPARKFLHDVVAGAILSKANRLFPNSPSEFMKYVKQAEFKTADLEILKSLRFDEVDINSIVAEGPMDGIASHYDWFNKSFQPDQKIEKGQMILVSMAPGCGKSLYAMSEALSMAARGHKVHYMALGDLNTKDFIVRMGAMYSGLSFGATKKNIGQIYDGMNKKIGPNLGVTIVPAGQVTVEEYLDFIQDQPYDVLFIDYDSNFKMAASDNMYSEYGDIYSKLTKLTMAGKIVFVLAQPKVGVWGNEWIDLQDVGESSRKQHTADIIITRGRVVGNPNNLGCFRIVKNRRGEVGVVDYSIRLGNGRFRSLPKSVYDTLKQEMERKEWTDSDIDSMITACQSNQTAINKAVQNTTFQGGPNPFKKP